MYKYNVGKSWMHWNLLERWNIGTKKNGLFTCVDLINHIC